MLNSLLEGCIARVDFLFVVFVGRSWRCSECFCEECCIGRSRAFLLGAGSILSGSSDEQSQLLTALVEKEVLPCRDVFFANCTHRYHVSDNWMSDCRLRLPHDLLFC